jgi:hypothetical protein
VTAPVAECAGCGGAIRSLGDAVEHADCHRVGEIADGALCGQERPLLRLAGVDLPQIPCIRPAGHAENVHRGVDGSEWSESIPDWWDEANQQVGDILAALIRRGGSDVAEIADDDLKRADGEVVRIQYDDDGCARVEITTEVPE